MVTRRYLAGLELQETVPGSRAARHMGSQIARGSEGDLLAGALHEQKAETGMAIIWS